MANCGMTEQQPCSLHRVRSKDIHPPATGLPAAGFLLRLRVGPPIETAEVASVSINVDSNQESDQEHDDVMYPQVLPFVLIHAGCVAAIWSGISWQAVPICAALYWLRMFPITGGYSR